MTKQNVLASIKKIHGGVDPPGVIDYGAGVDAIPRHANGVTIMKIQIELPDEIGVRRSDGTCIVKPGEMDATIIARLVEHGIVQKVGDAAAGAAGKMTDEDADAIAAANRLMAAARDRLYEGVWTAHGGGSSVDPVDRFARGIVRKNLTRDQKAEYKEAEDRDAYLDAILATQSDAVRDAVRKTAEAMHKADLARKAEDAAMVGKINLEV